MMGVNMNESEPDPKFSQVLLVEVLQILQMLQLQLKRTMRSSWLQPTHQLQQLKRTMTLMHMMVSICPGTSL